MHQDSQDGDDLDRLLTRALERKPSPLVPADFASRVVDALPTTHVSRLHWDARLQRRSFGRSAGLACVLLIFLTMLFLTPRIRGGDVIAVTAQCALCLAATSLMLWLTLDRSSAD